MSKGRSQKRAVTKGCLQSSVQRTIAKMGSVQTKFANEGVAQRMLAENGGEVLKRRPKKLFIYLHCF